jgi:hypothetical protein
MGGLTGLRPEGCGRLPAAGCVEGLCRKVVVAAPPQITKKGHGFAVGCVEGLHRFAQGATAALPLRVMVAPFGRRL